MKRWKRLLILLVIGSLVVGGALIYKNQKKMAAAERLKGQSLTLLAGADIYRASPENAEYIKTLAAAAHPAATRAFGRGLIATVLDEKDYYSGLLTEMIRQAKDDGRTDVARSLRDFGVGRRLIQDVDR